MIRYLARGRIDESAPHAVTYCRLHAGSGTLEFQLA